MDRPHTLRRRTLWNDIQWIMRWRLPDFCARASCYLGVHRLGEWSFWQWFAGEWTKERGCNRRCCGYNRRLRIDEWAVPVEDRARWEVPPAKSVNEHLQHTDLANKSAVTAFNPYGKD